MHIQYVDSVGWSLSKAISQLHAMLVALLGEGRHFFLLFPSLSMTGMLPPSAHTPHCWRLLCAGPTMTEITQVTMITKYGWGLYAFVPVEYAFCTAMVSKKEVKADFSLHSFTESCSLHWTSTESQITLIKL